MQVEERQTIGALPTQTSHDCRIGTLTSPMLHSSLSLLKYYIHIHCYFLVNSKFWHLWWRHWQFKSNSMFETENNTDGTDRHNTSTAVFREWHIHFVTWPPEVSLTFQITNKTIFTSLCVSKAMIVTIADSKMKMSSHEVTAGRFVGWLVIFCYTNIEQQNH